MQSHEFKIEDLKYKIIRTSYNMSDLDTVILNTYH